jgi:hypothetical protein
MRIRDFGDDRRFVSSNWRRPSATLDVRDKVDFGV